MSKFLPPVHTDRYSLYHGDCHAVMSNLPDACVDLCVYSPPFAGLYHYSSSELDLSNCSNSDQFLQQYEYMIAEMARITKAGRIHAVHCTDVMQKDESLWDFPNEIIKLYRKYGFDYRARIVISKEPMQVRLRTMVKSLMHITAVEDATHCSPAMPDYLLIFRKKGECEVPVTHKGGFTRYFGELPLLPHMPQVSGEGLTDDFVALSNRLFQQLQRKYAGFEGDHKENILSHVIYRRYMDAVWDDIRISNVLPYHDCRDPEDEKHVHPLQLDVIDRIVELYSNPDDVVLTPFGGVGSEVYSPVSLGRRAIGIELKKSYFRQMVANAEMAERRWKESPKTTLFDE